MVRLSTSRIDEVGYANYQRYKDREVTVKVDGELTDNKVMMVHTLETGEHGFIEYWKRVHDGHINPFEWAEGPGEPTLRSYRQEGRVAIYIDGMLLVEVKPQVHYFEPTCQLRFRRSAGTSTLPDTLQQFWRKTWSPTQGVLNDPGIGEWRDVPVEVTR